MKRKSQFGELCDYIEKEIKNFMKEGKNPIKPALTNKPNKWMMESEQSGPPTQDEDLDCVLGRLEAKKFKIMMDKKKSGQNSLIQADVKRLYPMNKVKTAGCSNLFQMTYGGQPTPRNGEEQFLAEIFKA